MSARVRTGVLPVYTVHQEASVASLRRFATAKLRWGLLSTSMPTRCAAQTAAHPVCDKSSTQGCPTAGIPKYLPARGLLLSTPPGQQPGCQPGYKQGPHPRIEAREQRVGTRTGAEQQSPGHCVQGTLAFASREGRDWLKCLHLHGLFTHATGQRDLLARRCLPARRLLTGNHVGLHPYHCPCPFPSPRPMPRPPANQATRAKRAPEGRPQPPHPRPNHTKP